PDCDNFLKHLDVHATLVEPAKRRSEDVAAEQDSRSGSAVDHGDLVPSFAEIVGQCQGSHVIVAGNDQNALSGGSCARNDVTRLQRISTCFNRNIRPVAERAGGECHGVGTKTQNILSCSFLAERDLYTKPPQPALLPVEIITVPFIGWCTRRETHQSAKLLFCLPQ